MKAFAKFLIVTITYGSSWLGMATLSYDAWQYETYGNCYSCVFLHKIRDLK